MDDATHSELADLIGRSSLGTPLAQALQDLAADDDIAAVFERAGYRPATVAGSTRAPVRGSTQPSPSVDIVPDFDDNPVGRWGPGKVAALLRLALLDHDQTYPTGSYRHKTVVDVVAALSDAGAALQARPLWLSPKIWKTTSRRRRREAVAEAEAAYTTLLMLLRYQLDETCAWDAWDDTHRLRPTTTIRSVVYVFVDETARREAPSRPAKHALEQLRNAIIHRLPSDAGCDFASAETDRFVCQIKNYSCHPARDLAVEITLPVAALWVIYPSPGSAPSFVLSRPENDHWTEQPVCAINIDLPGPLTRCN